MSVLSRAIYLTGLNHRIRYMGSRILFFTTQTLISTLVQTAE
jgi:hypothetical protein